MQRGKQSYIFSVVRPSKPSTEDLLAKQFLEELPSAKPASGMGSKPGSVVGDKAASVVSGVAPSAAAKSATVKFIRVEASGGTGITVEWRPDNTRFTHYQLEWKLADDSEWTHTDASSALKVTIVTKGNLKPAGAYEFRVRGCAADGVWGEFCQTSAPTRPDGKLLDGTEAPQLSSPAKTAGATTSRAPSVVSVAKQSVVSAAKSAVPTAQPSVARGTEVSTPGLSKETLSGVLDDQRLAIEAQHEQELSDLETNFLAQLHGIQADATNFKNKFLEMSGTQMQALLDAKTEARKEVVKEMAAEEAALEE
eukprot:1597406-Prymnesium_polylepis.1